MTGITQKGLSELRFWFISTVVPSKSCLQIKDRIKEKLQNPMILNEQLKKRINTKKAIKEKQSNVEIFLFEFQISEKYSLDQVLESITRLGRPKKSSMKRF